MNLDTLAKTALATALVAYLWLIGTRMEDPYPEMQIEGYAMPLTRMGLMALVLVAAAWSPTVGVLSALAFACLGMDVLLLTR